MCACIVVAKMFRGKCDEPLPELFRFPRDTGRVPTVTNRLNDQKLVSIYAREWGVFTR